MEGRQAPPWRQTIPNTRVKGGRGFNHTCSRSGEAYRCHLRTTVDSTLGWNLFFVSVNNNKACLREMPQKVVQVENVGQTCTFVQTPPTLAFVPLRQTVLKERPTEARLSLVPSDRGVCSPPRSPPRAGRAAQKSPRRRVSYFLTTRNHGQYCVIACEQKVFIWGGPIPLIISMRRPLQIYCTECSGSWTDCFKRLLRPSLDVSSIIGIVLLVISSGVGRAQYASMFVVRDRDEDDETPPCGVEINSRSEQAPLSRHRCVQVSKHRTHFTVLAPATIRCRSTTHRRHRCLPNQPDQICVHAPLAWTGQYFFP